MKTYYDTLLILCGVYVRYFGVTSSWEILDIDIDILRHNANLVFPLLLSHVRTQYIVFCHFNGHIADAVYLLQALQELKASESGRLFQIILKPSLHMPRLWWFAYMHTEKQKKIMGAWTDFMLNEGNSHTQVVFFTSATMLVFIYS